MRLVVHIGTHKTGTKSIQRYMAANREALRALGIDYYEGLLDPENHMELHVCAMRPERLSPYKALNGIEAPQPELVEQTAARVRAFIEGSPAETLVFSAEGLAYLRHDDELARLRALFGGRPFEAVVFRREPEAFLRAYAEQMRALGIPPSADPESFAYAEPGSWLTDVDALVAAYARRHPVQVVDYEAALARFGSVVPAFLEPLGLDPERAPDWRGLFLNVSAAAP